MRFFAHYRTWIVSHQAPENHPRRSLARAVATASLALAAASLGACTRPVTVDSDWLEGVPRNQSFSNLLVIGVTANFNVRCRFERALAASLRSANVTATASCAEMAMKDPLTREGVTPVVTRLGNDAVIATRLVDQKANLVEGANADTRATGYYKAVGYGRNDAYFGHYGLPVTYVEFVAEESVFTLQATVRIATNLYETRNASIVYALETTAADLESQAEAIDVITAAIAERLHRDGLVR